MTGLALEGLTKRFGSVTAVDHVDLHVVHGTLVCLLGPSGCGKTTLLRMIAGLEEPTSGRILLDGADITNLPAHRRDFGMVFQSLGLFPHLSVGDNIAYPLRIRGEARSVQDERVAQLLDLVHLPGFANRPISKLSGGQRQRVAIARALDAKLREAMQVELTQLQRRLGITTIVVTHDQREAMTMADLVVVMGEGRVRQMGSPVEIYRHPADTFVASFIGTTNLIPARTDGAAGASVPGGHIPGLTLKGPATVSVRPEDIALTDSVNAAMQGDVTFVRDLGSTIEVFIDCEGTEIVAVESPRARWVVKTGTRVGVAIDPEHCVVLGP